ncbi:MAG: FHA domain-containing protein [Verrucomicrobiota bacterium]
MSENADSVITLNLLDPLRGDALQSWEFSDAVVIRIGRSRDNDVVIEDMVVSRTHAVLSKPDGRWAVTALGRNGIIIDGRPISNDTPLRHENILRLGVDGPHLEFTIGRKRTTSADRLRLLQTSSALARERDEERERARRTDVTDVDLMKRLRQEGGKPPGAR